MMVAFLGAIVHSNEVIILFDLQGGKGIISANFLFFELSLNVIRVSNLFLDVENIYVIKLFYTSCRDETFYEVAKLKK